MSVTTTANSRTYEIGSVLADYEVHHSEQPPFDGTTNAHPEPNERPNAQNPVGWREDYRRVPPYRPVNAELDQSQRRVYQNNAERTFITMMFTGVATQANINRIWHATGEKIAPWLFRYKLGGEW